MIRTIFFDFGNVLAFFDHGRAIRRFAKFTDIPKLKPRYRVVLASNTNDAHFTKYTEQFKDVLSHFDHLVASHQVGARKPHDEFFAAAKKHANAEPHECVFVDDLLVNIEAANRAGFNGIVCLPDDTLAMRLRKLGVDV